MKIIKHIQPIDERIILTSDKVLLSKTNPKGIIRYVNDYFIEISGYTEPELIGQPHNIIRHPAMPIVIFNWLWKNLSQQKNNLALIKSLTTEGKYYWITISFEIKFDKEGNVNSFLAKRNKTPQHSVQIINDLYKKILITDKENNVGIYAKNIIGILEEKNTPYSVYEKKSCISIKKRFLEKIFLTSVFMKFIAKNMLISLFSIFFF